MSDFKIDTLEVESQIVAPAATTSVAGLQSPTDKTKLDSVQSGATANSTDAALRDRATHTGTQTASTISDFNTAASTAAPVQSVAGKVGAVSLVKADVGLANVDNTSDLAKPVSTAQQTAINTAQSNAEAYADGVVASLVDAAPGTLDTLNELAAALGDDPNFAATTAAALANRLRVDTAAQGLNSTEKTNAKTNVDLQNVNNTSDLDKPVSTATQTALNLKYDASNPNGYETPTQLNTRDTNNRARANHTGTQVSTTISDFTEAAQDSAASMITGATHDGVSVTYNDAGNTLALTNTDKGSVARTAHEAASDPHPQYLTSTEGNAAYQPLDGDLTAIAALAGAGLAVRTTTNTWATRSITAGSGITMANSDGVFGNPQVTNSDRGSTAVTTHEAALDPHPQYATDTALTSGLALKYDASNPSGFETPAQLNTRDTNNRNRTNHTGTQVASTISDFANAALSTVLTGISFATGTAVVATDSILIAIGKLQAQATAAIASLATKANLVGGNTFTGNQTIANATNATANLQVTPGWSGNTGTWVNFDTTGPSGIGTGGPGANPWIAYVQGGGQWFGDALAGDVAYRNQTGRLLFGTTAGDSVMRMTGNDLTVGPTGTALTNNPLSVNGNVDSFLQSNVQNLNAGTGASSDLVATANNGTDTSNFVNVGINSSAYADPTFTINGPNDSYVYSNGGDLSIGSATANRITFFTGGTLAANEAARITPTGQFGLGSGAPVASAKLQIDSTTQGFLLPRMTSAQRLAIASPAAGLMVYDTNLGGRCVYAGTHWTFEYDIATTAIQTTTSATYSNITELTTASLEPGLYLLRLRGIMQSTALTTGVGLKVLNGSATISELNINWTFSQAGNGTDKNYEYSQLAVGDNVTSTGVVTANANFPVAGDGVLRISAGGTIIIQFRSEVGASGVSIRPNSSLVLRKVSN